MAKTAWTYQQYDPRTRTFFPVPEDKDAYKTPGEVTVLGLPDDYDRPILEMFRRRDARRARRRVVAYQ